MTDAGGERLGVALDLASDQSPADDPQA